MLKRDCEKVVIYDGNLRVLSCQLAIEETIGFKHHFSKPFALKQSLASLERHMRFGLSGDPGLHPRHGCGSQPKSSNNITGVIELGGGVSMAASGPENSKSSAVDEHQGRE
jgi:hypothetical protein